MLPQRSRQSTPASPLMGPAMLMCQLNGPISNKRTTIGLQSTHITNLYKSCNIYFAFGKVNRFSTFPMALWSLFKTLHKFRKKVMCSHDNHLLDESWDLKASHPPTAWPRTSWLHSPHDTRGNFTALMLLDCKQLPKFCIKLTEVWFCFSFKVAISAQTLQHHSLWP